ncbi:unnamed protein product, partial [Owenia fusiformis]
HLGIMRGATLYEQLWLITILIICILQAFDCGKPVGCSSCTKKKNSRGKLLNLGTGRVTFSAIMDSNADAIHREPKENLAKVWKSIDRDVRTDEDVIQKGREFIAYVKDRFDVDMTIITDEQLQLGLYVHFGNLTFMGFVIDFDLRVVTETTPLQHVTHYRNTKYISTGYVIVANKNTILEGGKYTGFMAKNSAIYTETAMIDSNECDFEEEPHILITRTLDAHPANFYDGKYTEVNTWEGEVWSSKYGHGLQYGIDMHPMYVMTIVNVFPK